MPHTCINNRECKNNKPKLNKTKTTQSLLACNNIQIQNCRGSIHLEDLCATRYELFRVPHHSNNRLKWWQTACCSFWIKWPHATMNDGVFFWITHEVIFEIRKPPMPPFFVFLPHSFVLSVCICTSGLLNLYFTTTK